MLRKEAAADREAAEMIRQRLVMSPLHQQQGGLVSSHLSSHQPVHVAATAATTAAAAAAAGASPHIPGDSGGDSRPAGGGRGSGAGAASSSSMHHQHLQGVEQSVALEDPAAAAAAAAEGAGNKALHQLQQQQGFVMSSAGNLPANTSTLPHFPTLRSTMDLPEGAGGVIAGCTRVIPKVPFKSTPLAHKGGCCSLAAQVPSLFVPYMV
jgi:hypothetical protein